MLSYLKYLLIFLSISVFAEVNFTNPTIVTGDGGSPNLSNNGKDDNNPQIALDSSGHVYAIWNRSNGTNYIIQVAISNDYGVSWEDPNNCNWRWGSPNLSNNGKDAFNSHIAADSSGHCLCDMDKKKRWNSLYHPSSNIK